MRETRYGVCSARNERQSLSERELRIKNCVELELRFKNCVERIPGFPCIILSPFVFHIPHLSEKSSRRQYKKFSVVM